MFGWERVLMIFCYCAVAMHPTRALCGVGLFSARALLGPRPSLGAVYGTPENGKFYSRDAT